MDQRTVERACEAAFKGNEIELEELVRTDASTVWGLLGTSVAAVEDPHADSVKLAEYGVGMTALLHVGGEWPERVAARAQTDPKIASALQAFLGIVDPSALVTLLGMDLVVNTWVAYQTAEEPWDFWAVDLMIGIDRWATLEEGWAVILELLAASTDDVLGDVGAGPLEDFVHRNWQFAVSAIEKEAPGNPPLRAALGSMQWLTGVPHNANERFKLLSERD